MFQRVGTYFYILPTYAQGKKVIWDGIDGDGMKFVEHIPKEIIVNTNESEMRIELTNGSAVQIIGAENIDRIVGTNPVGVIFSEFSLMKEEVWSFIRPILAENGGWAVFIFTPRGMNHAWRLLQQAIGNPDWFSQVLTVEDTGAINDKALESERKEMPQDLFEQEYYCKFIEGAGAFFRRVRENSYDPEIALPFEGDFQVGADFAKHQDWTVLTPFNLNHFIVYPQDRFNQLDWNLQKAKVEAMCLRYNDALLWPDSTGLGDPIVDDLKARGLRIGGEDGEGFKFTETSRKNLLSHLAILLEQDKIKIPRDEGLIGELQSMRYELSDRGTLKLKVPDGMTDDRIMSLALAVWGVTERVTPDLYSMHKVYQNRMTPKTFK